jgi:hypothetical protein
MMNVHLDKQKIFYRYGVQIKASLLNAEYHILRNKIVEQNDLNGHL